MIGSLITSASCARGPSRHGEIQWLNQEIFRWYASGIKQRRLAIVLGVSRSTVTEEHHTKKLISGDLKADYIQFEEMMSFEHSKLKQLTIPIAIRTSTGEILGIEVEPST